MMPGSTRCTKCGRSHFPAAIVCSCGSGELTVEPITRGRVEATVRLTGDRASVLTTVRTASGVRVVAQSPEGLEIGESVLIECRSGRIGVVRAVSAESEGE